MNTLSMQMQASSQARCMQTHWRNRESMVDQSLFALWIHNVTVCIIVLFSSVYMNISMGTTSNQTIQQSRTILGGWEEKHEGLGLENGNGVTICFSSDLQTVELEEKVNK